MGNINKEELTICLMLEELGSDFSKELASTVANSLPSNKKIRLIVVPGKYDDGSSDDVVHNYRSVYNSVFGLGEMCHIDGFIIHLGSINEEDHNYSQIYQHYTNKWPDVPKVLVASDLKDATTINYDNESGIREAVDYLVNAYGCTNFCMLGGREDNKDARERREIFTNCLKAYDIEFGENEFEHTDMGGNCVAAAENLLDRNPDVQAVFCVNDSVAKSLYKVLNKRKIKIGEEVMVFAFDNTKLAGELNPPLTSIGPDKVTLGQKALEILLEKLSGKDSVEHIKIPTKLYGRKSFPFEKFDYTKTDLTNADPEIIDKMFSECFYRYNRNDHGNDSIDLQRLFYEVISRILKSMKRRYVSPENFDTICMLIDKFFENGGMDYTDASKFIVSIERLQHNLNILQRSAATKSQINRLFSRMKDRAIISQAEKINRNEMTENHLRSDLADFLVTGVGDGSGIETILHSFDKLGLQNCSLFVFDDPVHYDIHGEVKFPDVIKIKCVMSSGELYILPEIRQKCMTANIFERSILTSKIICHTALPIFCGNTIYGLLITELTDNIYDRGEFLALHLGKSFALCKK